VTRYSYFDLDERLVLCPWNQSTKNSTALGGSYVNDTGLKWQVVFMGAECFAVKEIEMLEITN
jgi:hypothetical protein